MLDQSVSGFAHFFSVLENFLFRRGPIAQFPQHKRANEAKSWRQVIKLALDAKKENERLSKNIERLKQLDVKQEEKRLGR